MTPTLQDRAAKAMEYFQSLGCGPCPEAIFYATAIEALRLAADPDMVWVPRVPTRDMVLAGSMVAGFKGTGVSRILAKERYQKMISAAPVATTEGG